MAHAVRDACVLILVFGLSVCLPVPVSGATNLAAHACSEEGALRSQSGAETSIRFYNDGQAAVSLHWLDFQGQRIKYADIPASSFVDQSTFVSHVWVLVASDGSCLGLYVAEPGPHDVHVAAGRVVDTGARLPTPRFGGSASWDGRFAYYAGGQGCQGGGFCDEIVRYDPSANTVAVMGAHLPTARKGTVSFSDGRFHYIIGGYDGQDLAEILRYDPASDVVETMGATFRTTYGSVAWSGQYAYLIGGFSGEGTVARYDPSSDEVVQLGLALPTGRHYASAVWIGQSVYLFGGERGATDLDEIVRLTPSDGTVVVSSARLPTPRHATGAFTDGRVAYVLGGETGCQGGPCDRPSEILRYDPATETLEALAMRLPEGRSYPEPVGDPSAVHVMAGIGCPPGFCDAILRIGAAGAVQAVDSPVGLPSQAARPSIPVPTEPAALAPEGDPSEVPSAAWFAIGGTAIAAAVALLLLWARRRRTRPRQGASPGVRRPTPASEPFGTEAPGRAQAAKPAEVAFANLDAPQPLTPPVAAVRPMEAAGGEAARPLQGKPRSFGRGLLLIAVTFTIYIWVWHYRVLREVYAQERMRRFPTGVFVGCCFPLVNYVFAPIYMSRLLRTVNSVRAARDLPPIFGLGGFLAWYILGQFILVGPFVAYHRIQKAVNEYWEHEAKGGPSGATTPQGAPARPGDAGGAVMAASQYAPSHPAGSHRPGGPAHVAVGTMQLAVPASEAAAPAAKGTPGPTAAPARPQRSAAKGSVGRARLLKCPRCGTEVAALAGAKPVCPQCGFGART